MVTKEKLMAAHDLLLSETTTREKYAHIAALLRGSHPRLDEALSKIDRALADIAHIKEGDVIMLSADRLPENTDEEKKRKKLLLLFVSSWRNLQTEVTRVEAEMNSLQNADAATKASSAARILKGAKGPLGLVTLVAIGLATMQQTSVELVIQNAGCGTLQASGVAINIPGFKIPQGTIPSGGEATVVIPPLPMTVNGTDPRSLKLTALKYTLTFELPPRLADVTFDGTSLLGTKTHLQLSGTRTHVLVLSCR